MIRLVLKIAMIMFFAHTHATIEEIKEAADIELESAETILKETYAEGGLANETRAMQDELANEAANRDSPSVAKKEIILRKDIMLVLDNSGSMKKADPYFLVNQAVRKFINLQDPNTRVGIVVFDQDVRLSISLTEFSSYENRKAILASIEDINYKGLFTDSPAGIERAVYELKNNDRDDVRKFIIFITDGIVDTGVAGKDIEKSKWLREDLASDAADNGIKIFGIAFTEEADFQLIQSIAQKTGGEYYRVLQAKNLQDIFKKINGIINTPLKFESVVKLGSVPPERVEVPQPLIEPIPLPPPMIIEVPAEAISQEERIRSIIVIAAVIVLTITLLGILFLLLRRNNELKRSEGRLAHQEAYINDLHGKTDKQAHKLGNKSVMFGRIAGQDVEHLDYIVVNESTIGRRHALIEFKDYSYWIIDQGSINGSFVNGKQVVNEVQLKHGDRIRLHKYEFEFFIPEMQDASMTVVSNTVFANQATVDNSEDITRMCDHVEDKDELNMKETSVTASSDMDFDITGFSSADDSSADNSSADNSSADDSSADNSSADNSSADDSSVPELDKTDPTLDEEPTDVSGT